MTRSAATGYSPTNMASPPRPERAFWRRALRSPGVQLLVLIVGAGLLLGGTIAKQGGLEPLRQRLGGIAPLVTVPAHAVIAISPLPSEVIAVGNGLYYGFWQGALLNWLGWMLAALVHYALARRAARDLDAGAWLARAPRWLRRFPAHHPVFLVFGRWIPYGPQLVCTVAGAYRVPVRRFASCTAVGVAPSAFFFSALASWLG